MFPPFRCRCGGSEVVANLKDQGGLDDGISMVFRKLKIEERWNTKIRNCGVAVFGFVIHDLHMYWNPNYFGNDITNKDYDACACHGKISDFRKYQQYGTNHM